MSSVPKYFSTQVLPRFWILQLSGWGTYALAMTFSRLGMFPLPYMVVSKGVLALAGFGCSLILWRIYRRVLGRGARLGTQVVVAVAASYLVSQLWTAIDNLADIPIAAALLGREVRYASVFRVFVGSVYNAFTLLAWSLLYFVIRHQEALVAERERALRAEALAERARLEALRYQVQPHFLFNSMNAVSTLIVEERPAEASRMLSRLADYLRLVLAVPEGPETSLAEELDLIERYLEVERVRFGERLRTEIRVDAEAWAVRVPTLLLQPAIENAIRHGIAPKEGGGELHIRAARAGDRLRVVVSDRSIGTGTGNGQGPPGEGIGLANMRERLARLYGDRQRLEVATTAEGTTVTIELPWGAA